MLEAPRAQHFPAPLTANVTAVAVDAPTFWQALDAISAAEDPFTSFAALGNYTLPPERATWADALRPIAAHMHQEHILFMQQDRCVGWSHGRMVDATTFFMAFSGVVRSCQRQGIYRAFVRAFLPYLHALGYERVTSNHMVNNRAVLIAKLKAGFVITGMVLDERYGAQVSLSYFFYEDRRCGFERAYSLEHYGAVASAAQPAV